MLVEIFDVGVAGQEPEQLIDDRLEVQLLGGEQREAVVERKAHLVAEYRERAGAGAVTLLHAALENLFHQFEILPHRPPLLPAALGRRVERWGNSLPAATAGRAFQLANRPRPSRAGMWYHRRNGRNDGLTGGPPCTSTSRCSPAFCSRW